MDNTPQAGQHVLWLVPSCSDTDFEFYAQLTLVMSGWYVRLMHTLYTCCLLSFPWQPHATINLIFQIKNLRHRMSNLPGCTMEVVVQLEVSRTSATLTHNNFHLTNLSSTHLCFLIMLFFFWMREPRSRKLKMFLSAVVSLLFQGLKSVSYPFCSI